MKEKTSQKRAREIMGRNFFSAKEAIKYFGVNPTKQQLAVFAEIPFPDDVLEGLKDTHVLVAVFPLSILEIRGKVDSKLFYRRRDSWYDKESFAKERGGASWQLIRKAPVDDSTSKSWGEQQALRYLQYLGFDMDKAPSARVMVYTIIGHYLATGKRLFKYAYKSTFSVDSTNLPVDVGYFDSTGINIRGGWE